MIMEIGKICDVEKTKKIKKDIFSAFKKFIKAEKELNKKWSILLAFLSTLIRKNICDFSKRKMITGHIDCPEIAHIHNKFYYKNSKGKRFCVDLFNNFNV